MKKSEILKKLGERVEKYYIFGEETKILAVYVNYLDWRDIKQMGTKIIDITPSEQEEELIRVTFDVEID